MLINSPNLKRRFGGIIRLYGLKKFKKFQSSHVCIIGIGGVGSWVAESMARHGIGQITMIDMDHIAESNINRQIHALDSSLGQSKVEAMRLRILDINPNCKVNCHDSFLEESNISELISKRFDFVIDAIDQTKIKILLAEYCLDYSIPFIMTGGAGGKVNPEVIKIDVLAKTFGDPLLTKIRQYFNKKNKLTNAKNKIPTVFSSELAIKPETTNLKESPRGLSCAGYGSSVNVTATFAFLSASYVLSNL
jgi:tRNA A37 threonylcarbamoyladenosine dehydratase